MRLNGVLEREVTVGRRRERRRMVGRHRPRRIARALGPSSRRAKDKVGSMTEQLAIAIDIGGTKIGAGVVDSAGELLIRDQSSYRGRVIR